MRMLRIAGLLIFASLAACSTPPEIKQALAAKDQAYTENEQLMQQYRELVTDVNSRHQQWYRYVQTRLKLDLALQWATTNPRLTDVPDTTIAEDDAGMLGADVLAVINTIRLKSLRRSASTLLRYRSNAVRSTAAARWYGPASKQAGRIGSRRRRSTCSCRWVSPRTRTCPTCRC